MRQALARKLAKTNQSAGLQTRQGRLAHPQRRQPLRWRSTLRNCQARVATAPANLLGEPLSANARIWARSWLSVMTERIGFRSKSRSRQRRRSYHRADCRVGSAPSLEKKRASGRNSGTVIDRRYRSLRYIRAKARQSLPFWRFLNEGASPLNEIFELAKRPENLRVHLQLSSRSKNASRPHRCTKENRPR
jgi:hypothetical protein